MGKLVETGQEKIPAKRAWAKPKLRKFLNEKGAYKQFVDNIQNKKAHRRWLGSIDEAFLWRETTEGSAFWRDLAREYHEQS